MLRKLMEQYEKDKVAKEIKIAKVEKNLKKQQERRLNK